MRFYRFLTVFARPGTSPVRFVGGIVPKALYQSRVTATIVGTPEIYTTTGFGPRKNREMAGVDHLVDFFKLQTAVCKIQQLVYTPPRGRFAPPGWCI